MALIFLNILKIIGIILLCLLLLVLTLLLLILFVPVRYRIKGFRKEGDEVPVRVEAKVTWLLHILNIAFSYPEEAYVKVRVFCFTVFSTKKDSSDKKKEAGEDKKSKKKNSAESEPEKQKIEDKNSKEQETVKELSEKDAEETPQETMETSTEPLIEEEEPKWSRFIKKLFSILKNIMYTIRQIYDKIKHIIKNIRYYIGIIKSNSFQRAWSVCSKEAIRLIKSILPRKITADFTIGTGDPASTAKILSLEGILYPFIGNQIHITPDFDNTIIEGSFFIKGKITICKLLITAIKVYFNRDLRRVIRLFKKEAA